MKKLKKTSELWSLGTFMSLFALVVSIWSFRDAHEAQRMSYESSLPMLSETTDLVTPITPAQPIIVRIVITNFGHTTAKQMEPLLRAEFGKSSNPFVPNFDDSKPAGTKSTPSDLPPGDHTTLVSTTPVSLAHDHDVAAVLNGEYSFYIFGKVPFKDILGGSHEFHFCRVITTPVAGADPLKIQKCGTFNYSY
jgi:hypothetical protein